MIKQYGMPGRKDVNNTDLNYANNKNPHPGFGTHITGNNNTSLGYDYNTTINPSIKVWNPSPGVGILQNRLLSLTNIASYNAYCIFVREQGSQSCIGHRALLLIPTVLRITGGLNENGQGVTKTFKEKKGDIVFIGNPFASTINVLNVINSTKALTPDKFWVWDPKLAGTSELEAMYLILTVSCSSIQSQLPGCPIYLICSERTSIYGRGGR